jgi:hypothetical protein
MNHTIRSCAILCLMAILLPMSAKAALPSTVKVIYFHDVLKIIKQDTPPLSFEISVKGSSNDLKGTISITGVQKGNSSKDNTSDMTINMSASLEGGSTARASIRMIHVDTMLYLRIDSIDVTGPFATYEHVAKPYLKQWFSFPTDPDESASSQSLVPSQKLSISKLDALLSVTKTGTKDNATYTVTLPTSKKRAFFMAAMGSVSRYTGQYNTMLRRSARSSKSNLTLTVNTIRSLFDSMAGQLEIATTVNDSKMRFLFDVNIKVLEAIPPITAPVDSTPWEEFAESQNQMLIKDARNTQRRSDINTILNAIYQYAIDHNGALPKAVRDAGTDEVGICKTGEKICDGISLDTLIGSYIVNMPVDPQQGATMKETGYLIRVDTMGRVTVSAPGAEIGVSISVTR